MHAQRVCQTCVLLLDMELNFVSASLDTWFRDIVFMTIKPKNCRYAIQEPRRNGLFPHMRKLDTSEHTLRNLLKLDFLIQF